MMPTPPTRSRQRRRLTARIAATRQSMAAADARLLTRSSAARSPATDRVFGAASQAANRSTLWLVLAAVLAAMGRRGRHAAADGIIAIGLASAAVNGPLKLLARRARPSLAVTSSPERVLPMPGSFSFPSGHTASAFAFATALTRALPVAGLPVLAAAGVVGYSRIHTGVHYPSDVLAGAGIGVLAGVAAPRVLATTRSHRYEDKEPAAAIDNGVPRRAVLLTSPHAGSAGGLNRARAAMLKAGFSIAEEIPIHNAHDLTGWITRPAEQVPLIVAAGGDGTVGAAADMVTGSGAVLAVLPLGTSNDFARSLGIPTDPVRAARLLASGKISTIDAGQLLVPGQAPRHFVHAATVGLNVSFAKLATQASLRRRFGRLTYAVAAAKALHQHEQFQCPLRYDDGRVEQLRLVHLSVINAPIFGGFLGMRVSGANLDDRALDIIAVEHLSVRRLLQAAAQPILGISRPIPGIHTLHAAHLTVHTSTPHDVALDGELIGTIPADFQVAGDALRVVTPQEFEDVDDDTDD